MAELPPVVPGEPVDSSTFGNPVVDRVLSRYADATARDSAVPIPQTGDFAYLEAERVLQVYDLTDGRWVDYMSTLAGETVEAALSPGGVIRRWNGDGDTDANRRFEWRRSASFGELELYGVDAASVATRLMTFQADTGGKVSANVALTMASASSVEGGGQLRWDLNRTDAGYFRWAISGTGELLLQGGPNEGSLSTLVTLDPTGRWWLDTAITDVRLQGAAGFATTATANMAIPDLANGLIRIATSARKYKSDIQAAPELADLVLEPVSFYREDDDRDLVGFIAEDLADQDERLALYDGDGEVDNFADRGLMAIMAAKINRLEAKVAELEAAL